MAFDKEALDHFFQDQEELGIAEVTQQQLVEEGVSTLMDLHFIDVDLIKELANNLCQPSGTRKTAHPFSVTLQTKMINTVNCVRHCITMGREVSLDHCHCAVVQNFAHQWKVLEKQRDGNQPTPPEVGKDLNML